MNLFKTNQVTEYKEQVEEYAEEVKWKLKRYEELVEIENVSEEERAERAELRRDLERLSARLAGEVKDKFAEIELQRKKNG